MAAINWKSKKCQQYVWSLLSIFALYVDWEHFYGTNALCSQFSYFTDNKGTKSKQKFFTLLK